MSTTSQSIQQTAIDTIRTLSMDAVQAANSGHPGTPMALAPVAFQIYTEEMSYNPKNPHWANRDRFVLSCGHASMLLYSMIHLSGIRHVDRSGKIIEKPALELDDLKNFRQLHSPCAGHPEYAEAAGIETTTGPLGQGVGNAIGMALASKHLGAKYNRDGFSMFDFNVYALCSDGDLMEGVACEAASLAGHLKLSNLCLIYDDNNITIEGETDLAFSEDVGKRFESYGFDVLVVDDANDLQQMQNAFRAFKSCNDKPTLIVLKSIIGFGSPNKANSHAAHGAPLGDEEIALTKKAYGWPENEKFLVPDEVREYFDSSIGKRGQEKDADWQKLFAEYAKQYPQEAAEVQRIIDRELPSDWDANLQLFEASEKGMATRVSSGKVLNMLSPKIPQLIGGSADLAPSTMTLIDGEADFGADNFAGRNMHFGIREHGMASILNGMSLCGLRPYGATFFVFTDYMRPSMRLSSIMHQPVLYVLTHDSIGLGEDGPTHQPVEHLAACRAIPGLYVFRPGDANEVLHCYRAILQLKNHPAALVLSRQNVPTFERSKLGSASGAEKGAYILSDCDGTPDVILIGTGTELSVCMEAQTKLKSLKIKSRVVSMPCFELFDDQSTDYRESVLPPKIKHRIACEAGIQMGWDKYLGSNGAFVGMSSFGASAPFSELYQHFKITADKIVAHAQSMLA